MEKKIVNLKSPLCNYVSLKKKDLNFLFHFVKVCEKKENIR